MGNIPKGDDRRMNWLREELDHATAEVAKWSPALQASVYGKRPKTPPPAAAEMGNHEVRETGETTDG